MKKLFSVDGDLMSFLTRLADLAILNVIFLITCLPIVTIGPALVALYSVTLKMVKNEESYIFKGYFKAFKDNFKISFISWLILLAAFFMLYIDLQIANTFAGSIRTIMTVLFFFMLLVCIVLLLYLFPYIARFENTLRNSFKNSFIIAVASLQYTILMLIITVSVIVLSFFVIPLQYSILMWIIFGFSAIALLHSVIFRRVFAKYEPPVDS